MASILDMMFARGVSVRIYGLGAVALGITGLVWGDFAVVWQLVSNGVAVRSPWAYAVAILALLAGLAIQWKRTAAAGIMALLVMYALGEILIDVPSGIAQPLVFGAWYSVPEHLALAAAGLIAYLFCARLEPATAERLTKIARLAFGICLVYFGWAHQVYLAHTAEMVPAWLPPGQIFWAYATGAGHILAGIAILSGIWARPAAILLTAMFVVFTFLVHIPLCFSEPHVHMHWAENAVNIALIGSAWVIAASLPARQSEPQPAGRQLKSQSL